MNFARAIQQRMQRTPIPTIAGYDIGVGCQPAAAAGGDFYDVSSSSAGGLGLAVADVSSHGFGPALIMSDTRRLLRTLSRQGWDIKEILGAINQALLEDTDDSLFVTMFLAMLDCQTGQLRYCGAGHEAHVINQFDQSRRLDSASLPLGVSEKEEFRETGVAQLRPGEVLVMLSDGFQEAQAANGELFGVERCLETVAAFRGESAQQIIEELFRTVYQFCRPGIPKDDMTAAIVKVDR
jgi:serine phosphatase RsbU (regulator of sigma subunit)